MKNYQQANAQELQHMLEERNYWLRIHNNKLLCKTQASRPSKIIDEGTSLILSYYNEHMKYLCTIHKVITKDGKTIHEHVKDIYLEGIWYKTTN
jgi:hypothetical protein